MERGRGITTDVRYKRVSSAYKESLSSSGPIVKPSAEGFQPQLRTGPGKEHTPALYRIGEGTVHIYYLSSTLKLLGLEYRSFTHKINWGPNPNSHRTPRGMSTLRSKMLFQHPGKPPPPGGQGKPKPSA